MQFVRIAKFFITISISTFLLQACGGGGGSSDSETTWVYNTDWLNATNVWSAAATYFCDTVPYDDCGMDGRKAASSANASVQSWDDMRFHALWPKGMGDMVDLSHAQGMQRLGTLSNIWFWQKQADRPSIYDLAISRDPFGNVIDDDSGWFPGDSTNFTALHPQWEAKLLDDAKTYINQGVDGLLIDEGAFIGTPMEFNPTVVAEFNDYLATIMTVPERENLATSLGFPSFAQFDYAQVWRDQLLPGTTEVDEATWNDRLSLNIPLWAEYDRYRQLRGIAVMDRIVTASKAHASNQGRELPVGFNIGPAIIDGMSFIHLADFVDLEFIYAVPAGTNPGDYHYFPEGRGAATVKLLKAFGIKANLFASLPTVNELNTRGPGNVENAFKIMIADGYAAGGRFHVEETFIDLDTNFNEIAPYYRFVAERPDLFDEAGKTYPRVGILQLWEQYSGAGQPRRNIDGTAQMLADDGYQYEVIFGAEDVDHLFPSPPQVLDETLLVQHDAIVIPGLVLCWFCGPTGNGLMLAENHSGKLLDYVNQGGLLIVQAVPSQVANGISANTGPLANELLGYLQSGTRAVGAGVVVHIPQVLGPDYQATTNSNDAQMVRDQLTSVLVNNSVSSEVSYTGSPRAVSAYMYRANNYTVVHLVNYDHDIDTDSITSVSNLEVSIDISTLPTAVDYSVTWQRPESPNESTLVSHVAGDQLVVTVPVISPWTALRIDPVI